MLDGFNVVVADRCSSLYVPNTSVMSMVELTVDEQLIDYDWVVPKTQPPPVPLADSLPLTPVPLRRTNRPPVTRVGGGNDVDSLIEPFPSYMGSMVGVGGGNDDIFVLARQNAVPPRSFIDDYLREHKKDP
jgi:hypothetical protein